MTIKELEILQAMIGGLLSLACDNKQYAAEDLSTALQRINGLIYEKYREEGER